MEQPKIVEFVHLHNHSHFSVYDGMQKMEIMASRAKELGFPGIALTDHGKTAGFPSFVNACKKYEIKPILGLEAYYVDDFSEKKSKVYHQTILCKNPKGYENLNILSSISHKQIIKKFTNEFPCLMFDDLKNHNEGLIITSGCTSSKLSQLIIDDRITEAYELAKKYKEVWEGDYYLEAMLTGYAPQDKVYEYLKKISKDVGIEIISTNDVHYSYKKEAEDQKLKISISRNGPLPPDYSQSSEYYMKSYEEMREVFSKDEEEEYLKNTIKVFNKIENISFPKMELPVFQIPNDNEEFNEYKKTLVGRCDEFAYLKYCSFKGLKRLGLDGDQKYINRLEEELETIRFTKFKSYFLIVFDYCDFARKDSTRIGCGRGSGTGSLVLYCLGVTGINPVKYKLKMDRFLFAKADYRAKPDAFFDELTEDDKKDFNLNHEDREEYFKT